MDDDSFTIQEFSVLAALAYSQGQGSNQPFGNSAKDISALCNISVDKIPHILNGLIRRDYVIQGSVPDHSYTNDGKEIEFEKDIDSYEILPSGVAALIRNTAHFIESQHSPVYDIPDNISQHIEDLYNFSQPPIFLEPIAEIVSASDRFVNVRDNQEPFDQLENL